MQRDIESGFGALFDFQFDRYLTIPIVKLAYRLAFGLACLNALVSLILIFTYVGIMFRGMEYGALVQLSANA